jgi:hypothetical protein
LVSVEKEGGKAETEDAKCTPRQQNKKEALTGASGDTELSHEPRADVPRAVSSSWIKG